VREFVTQFCSAGRKFFYQSSTRRASKGSPSSKRRGTFANEMVKGKP